MHEDVRTNTRTYMSVKEMGELLGLGRTESYWLINKKYFPSATRYGKTWVELAGFEDWYANQVKYRKKSGEEPGIMLRERSFSVKELAQLLSISDSAVYDLIKKNLFRTTACNGWMRVPKDSFWQWYEGQDRYRTREDRERDAELESSSLSFADMGKCLGISRDEAYRIVKSKKYGSVFESIMLAGKPRITKESFEKFLKGQDEYRLLTDISAKEKHTGSTLQKADMAVTDLSTASTSGHDLSGAAPPGSCHPESEKSGNARFEPAVPGDGDPRASMPGYALPDAAPPGSGFHEAALPENIRFESAAPKSGCPKRELPGTTISEAALTGPSRNALHEDSENRYITLAEAARMAGISRQAVSEYAKQGRFLMMKKGKNVRLGRPEFCQWLEARRSMQAPSCRPEHDLNGETAGRKAGNHYNGNNEKEGVGVMASIKERNGKYCVIYSFRNSDGKKKQKWETYRTREEAEKRRKKIEREEAAGGFTVPPCSCLDDLLREYVALYGKDKWALSTYGRNSRMIENYISPMIGGTKIPDISTRFLELYYQRLLSTPAVQNNAPKKEGSGMVGMSTIRDIHKLLRSCFEQAVKWEIMDKNPSLHATVPRYKSKKREIWTADILMKATELCGDGELKLAMNLAFSGSLRIGELAGLTWDCVDITPEAVEKNRASIFINKEFQRVSKEAVSQLGGKDIILAFPSESPRCTTVRVLKAPKTESSIRRVYLPRSVARMLIGWKEEQEKAKQFAGEDYHDYNLVMATWSGMPIGISVIEKRFAKLIRENGLPEVVFHSLRHSSITYKLKLNGGDIKSVQGDSGHAQSKMVSDVYSHIIDEDRRRNAEAFEEAFYGKKNLSPSLAGSAAPPASDNPGAVLLSGTGTLPGAVLLPGAAQMPDGIDPALLAKVLSNPEMLALISALAKSI